MSAPVKVYAFCNSGNGTDWQAWMAIAETGHVITTHISSSRRWGIHDVGPEWKQSAYEDVLGEGVEVDYIVVDDGQVPPDEVREANRKLGEIAALQESAAAS